ncbi:MAG: hypothetical protein WCO89_05615, partial [Syntrophus sp. (in: bacteria)]
RRTARRPRSAEPFLEAPAGEGEGVALLGREACLAGAADLLEDLIDRFNEVAGCMADPKPDDNLDKLMDEMGRLQEQIDACNGWELDRLRFNFNKEVESRLSLKLMSGQSIIAK